MRLLDEHIAALRSHAHRQLEARDKKPGWARGHVKPFPHACPWDWHHMDELVKAGLLERSEDWMDYWYKLTDEGWQTLSTLSTEAQP